MRRLHAVFYVATEEKEYPEISVTDFPAHVDSMHADSDFAFSQEFEVRHFVYSAPDYGDFYFIFIFTSVASRP